MRLVVLQQTVFWGELFYLKNLVEMISQVPHHMIFQLGVEAIFHVIG